MFFAEDDVVVVVVVIGITARTEINATLMLKNIVRTATKIGEAGRMFFVQHMWELYLSASENFK